MSAFFWSTVRSCLVASSGVGLERISFSSAASLALELCLFELEAQPVSVAAAAASAIAMAALRGRFVEGLLLLDWSLWLVMFVASGFGL